LETEDRCTTVFGYSGAPMGVVSLVTHKMHQLEHDEVLLFVHHHLCFISLQIQSRSFISSWLAASESFRCWTTNCC